MGKFNFKTLTSIKLPDWTERMWESRLFVTIAAVAAISAPIMISRAFEAPTLPPPPAMTQQAEQTAFQEQAARMMQAGTPRIFDHGKQSFDVNPADNQKIMRDPIKRRAFFSTVMLVSLDQNGKPYADGSGTVLSGYQVGGRPVVISIRHVTDLVANGIPDGQLIAVDRHGTIIGHLKPLPNPEAGKDKRDYPTLSYFDPNYPIDSRALQAIPGVEIAHELAPSMLAGLANDEVITPGASGGGWYNADGKLIGVVNGYQTTKFDRSLTETMVAYSPYNALINAPQPEKVALPLTGSDDIQSVAFGPALAQLAALSRHHDEPALRAHTIDETLVTDGFGFAFPDGIPMSFTSLLFYDQPMADKITNEMTQQLAEEAQEASPGLTTQ